MFDFMKEVNSWLYASMWGILVVVIIKYRQRLFSLFTEKEQQKKVLNQPVPTDDTGNKQESHQANTEKDLKGMDSVTDTAMDTNEQQNIDCCDIGLKDLNSIDKLQTGEIVLESLQLRRNLSDLTKRSKMLETDSVHDGDSMVVNYPNEDGQDEVDIADLTPDDITVSDEDEDNDSNISPQAMADIEAELLDSSILDESMDDTEKLNAGSDQQDDENTSSEQVNESTLNEDLAKAKLEKISKIHMEKQRLDDDELEEERRIQQNQLSDILTLMEDNPQMFGDASKKVLSEQANLYCI